MIQFLKKGSWSPYKVGTAIGFITWVTFLIMFKAPGVSTTFVRFVGFLFGIFSHDFVIDTDYLANYVAYKPVFDWQFALVIGIFMGAFLSKMLSGITFTSMPYLWVQRFGATPLNRNIGAFIGGFLVLFGARMAGGCTMGHGLSGGLQLATSSWIFMAVFFSVGILTANILYRGHKTNQPVKE